MKAVFGLALLACLFWFVIFSPWTTQWGNFWLKMVAATGILALFGLFSNRAILKQVFSFKVSHLATGIISAAILYALFWVGHAVSNLLFGFSESQITAIYSSKFGYSSILIDLLLFFWIGPAEEIFWRGFFQQRLGERFGVFKGLIIASLCYGLGLQLHADFGRHNVRLFLGSDVCPLQISLARHYIPCGLGSGYLHSIPSGLII